MEHTAEFKIRTFHTDAFGHVNNARYLELLEEARWQYAESIGLVDMLKKSHLGFIIMDLKIRFRAPVIEGDAIVVATKLVTLGSASGEVVQNVSKTGASSVATRCISHFILIDRSDNRSIPIEGAVRELLLQVIQK